MFSNLFWHQALRVRGVGHFLPPVIPFHFLGWASRRARLILHVD